MILWRTKLRFRYADQRDEVKVELSRQEAYALATGTCEARTELRRFLEASEECDGDLVEVHVDGERQIVPLQRLLQDPADGPA
jgi:hypothetical protein